MGSSTGEIYQNFGGVAEMTNQLTAGKREIEDALDGIETQVRALVASWDSEAQRSYSVSQARWNEAEAGLIQVLNDVIRVVTSGNENMQGTERGIANSFGG